MIPIPFINYSTYTKEFSPRYLFFFTLKYTDNYPYLSQLGLDCFLSLQPKV